MHYVFRSYFKESELKPKVLNERMSTLLLTLIYSCHKTDGQSRRWHKCNHCPKLSPSGTQYLVILVCLPSHSKRLWNFVGINHRHFKSTCCTVQSFICCQTDFSNKCLWPFHSTLFSLRGVFLEVNSWWRCTHDLILWMNTNTHRVHYNVHCIFSLSLLSMQ